MTDYKKLLDELEFDSTDADIDCGGAHIDAINIARELLKLLENEKLQSEKAIDYTINLYDDKLGVLMENNAKLSKNLDKVLKGGLCHNCEDEMDLHYKVCSRCFYNCGGY